jgi:hypothetical protein
VVLVLERASDGARASVEMAGRGLSGLAHRLRRHRDWLQRDRRGVVLSVAGEAIAFIPERARAARCCMTNNCPTEETAMKPINPLPA